MRETKGVSQGCCWLYTVSLDKREAVSHPYSFLFAYHNWMFFPPGIHRFNGQWLKLHPPDIWLWKQNLYEQHRYIQWLKALYYLHFWETFTEIFLIGAIRSSTSNTEYQRGNKYASVYKNVHSLCKKETSKKQRGHQYLGVCVCLSLTKSTFSHPHMLCSIITGLNFHHAWNHSQLFYQLPNYPIILLCI